MLIIFSSGKLVYIPRVSSETICTVHCQFIESQFLFFQWLSKHFSHQRPFCWLNIAIYIVLYRPQSESTVVHSVKFTVILQVESLALMKPIKITLFSCQAAESAGAGQCLTCCDKSVLWNRHWLLWTDSNPTSASPAGAVLKTPLCCPGAMQDSWVGWREKILSD